MALTWDITGCKELRNGNEGAITDALIWYTMFTDIGWEITEANAPEFYARIHLLEVTGTTMLTENGEPVFIKPDDVRRHIGMKVNVSPVTRLKWMKRQVGRLMDEYTNDYTHELEEAE